MTVRKKTSSVFLGLLAIALLGQFPLAAQEPGAPKADAPTAKKKQEPSRRVPPYFGQIGLTAEQRASIYAVQTKHQEKIDALEKQIATEKAAMLAACENVLNETQKKLLDNLRHAAAESNHKTADPNSQPANAPKSSK